MLGVGGALLWVTTKSVSPAERCFDCLADVDASEDLLELLRVEEAIDGGRGGGDGICDVRCESESGTPSEENFEAEKQPNFSRMFG